METTAVVLKGPRDLSLEPVPLVPGDEDRVVVDIRFSGISTGTEKLLWSGEMPPFPGMGYPLIPGYEACGEVVEAGRESGFRAGDAVFVPGASCFGDIRGLFGAAARQVATRPDRLIRLDGGAGPEGALLSLAATALHALDAPGASAPDLIIGHGVLGRLLAQIAILRGAPAPTVWEIDPLRRDGNGAYEVIDPRTDSRRDYRCIYDASGAGDQLDTLIGRLARGGEIVLAGFYAEPLSFAFPPAFMREARIRIAAEFTQEDSRTVADWIADGRLDLRPLITHTLPASRAAEAYERAFEDSACLKMMLDWRDC